MAFPSTLSTFSDPNATDKLNSPSHSSVETAQNSAIRQLEKVIGTDASTIGTILGDLRNITSDGGGHVQTAVKGGTGQTTFTKGDILVAQSASVLAKLAIGIDGQSLVADSSVSSGVKWGNPTYNVQSFLSTGTWTKPSVATTVHIQVWAGGGSGGANDDDGGSGGGGGGAYNEAWVPASVLGASVLATVGAGGSSVAAGSWGNAGGTTVFGDIASIVSAYGGGRGNDGGASNNGLGGGGGGIFGAGDTGGNGGDPYGGTAGVTGATAGAASVAFGIVGGAGGGGADTNSDNSTAGANGVWGGGGGGAGAYAGTATKGGNSQMGGAGGGGAGKTAGAAGGSSSGGGNGGAGGAASVAGIAGTQPAGGGGGGYNAKSGAGGDGKIIVTTYI